MTARPRVVCDASALVALLLDDGPDGRWVAETLGGSELAAPSLAAFETANVLRRLGLVGDEREGQVRQAHQDLLDLSVEWWPYEALAVRAWELRSNLSLYDAAYVALAELLDVPLVTLDRRIAGAPGVRSPVLVPPEAG